MNKKEAELPDVKTASLYISYYNYPQWKYL